jgi:hypothetical protein
VDGPGDGVLGIEVHHARRPHALAVEVKVVWRFRQFRLRRLAICVPSDGVAVGVPEVPTVVKLVALDAF